MTESAEFLRAAIDYAEQQFAVWRREEHLTERQFEQVQRDYAQWRGSIDPERDYSAQFTTDWDPSHYDHSTLPRLQLLAFLKREVRRRHAAQQIEAGPTRYFLSQIEHQATLLSAAPRGGAPALQEPQPAPRARGVVELLLDPRSLNLMMACGGALLTLGLVAWLWAVGVFENKVVVACLLGGANLAALAAGVALTVRTRHQTAGRAITMLASLLLPLNLWFYHAQGLITLHEGGRLWVPALAACVIYAGIARLLKDPAYVYAFVGGVTLTGLLFLADQQVDRFFEFIGPSALLVTIGVVCVHVERLFPGGPTPFGRERFGAAFYQSGHVALALGLAVLFAGRLLARLHDSLLAGFGLVSPDALAGVANAGLMTLALTAAGAYTYCYSLFAGRRDARYAYSAIVTLVWCEEAALEALAAPLSEKLAMIVLGATAVAAAAASRWAPGLLETRGERDAESGRVAAALSAAATALCGLGLLLGVEQFVRGVFRPPFMPGFVLDWFYVSAMLSLAAAGVGCCVLQARSDARRHAAASAHVAVIAGVLGLMGGLQLLGVESIAARLSLSILAPAALQVAAAFRMHGWRRDAWSSAAQVGGGVLLLLALPVALGAAAPGGAPVLLGVFLMEAAALFALAASMGAPKAGAMSGPTRGRGAAPVIASLSAWGAGWQWALLLGLGAYSPIVSGSVLGLVCLACSRLVNPPTEDGHAPRASWLAPAGRTLVTLGGVAGLLLTLNRLFADEAQWALLGVLGGQAIAATLAGALVRDRDSRRGLFALASANALLGALVVNAMSVLTLGQRLELMTSGLGLALLFAGHLGWRREGEARSGAVTFSLAAGSLLAAAPLVIGLAALRLGDGSAHWAWATLHNVGALAIGLLLLGLGVLCRIRSTTLAGAATLVAYVASLVMLIHLPEELQSVAVYLMAGGGAFFTTAVLLSVYRDRVLQVPDRVRNGEGVFRVLTWR